MQFEKKYWSKGEYTDKNGNDYIGYVGIFNGEAYSFKDESKLNGKNTYLARINCSNKNFDRTLSYELKLPYSRTDIGFAANDFAYSGIVKTAVQRLQENNDYLFRNALISSSTLPATDECVLLSSLVDSEGNLRGNGGILGKYNFATYAFDTKTQLDNSFYPETETYSRFYAKSKSGKKEERLSENTVIENGKKPADIYESSDDAAIIWKNIYNGGKNVEIVNPNLSSETIDLDAPGIISEDELMHYHNIAIDNISNNNGVAIKEYHFKKLAGEYIEKELASSDRVSINFITNIISEFGKYSKLKLSFLIKNKPDENGIFNIPCHPVLSEINASPLSIAPKVYKVNEEWNYCLYDTSDAVADFSISDSYNELIIKFSEDVTIAAKPEDEHNKLTAFDASYVAGDYIDNYTAYSIIPSVSRDISYSFIWTFDGYTGDKSSILTTEYTYDSEGNLQAKEINAIKSKKNCTYQFLIESDDWLAAKKANKNPRLIMLTKNKVGGAYIPENKMTAADVYNYATNNFANYDFPQIFREVHYNSHGQVANPNYKEISYLTELYDIADNIIINSYKFAEDVWNDLHDDEGDRLKENYDKIPAIIKEDYTVTVGEENLIHNFNEIVASDIIVHHIDKEKRKALLLVFLLFKNKLVIFKTDYFYKNISQHDKTTSSNFIVSDADYLDDSFKVDLNPGSAIIIENVNPHDKTSLKFLGLNAIKVYKNMIYLVDSKLDMVLRYDIDYLVDEAETDSNTWFNIESVKLLDIMQGLGDSTDKIYFNNPYSIDVNDDYVYIVDRNNNCVKEYTTSLDFVKVLKNGFFASHDIQAVGINPYPCNINGTEISNNSVWIVSVLGTRIFISVLDKDIVKFYGQIEDINLLQDDESWLEEIRSIQFSETHSNYFYLNTTKRIYKLHVSNPLYAFASLSYFKQRSIVGTMKWAAMRYPWHRIPSIYGAVAGGSKVNNKNEITWDYIPPTSSAEILDNKCFALASHPEIEGDIIFHYGVLYDNTKIKEYIRKNKSQFPNNMMTFNDIPLGELAGMIKSSAMLMYLEPDSFVSSVSNELIKIHDIYELENNMENDYINAMTFNKMLHGLVYNLLEIKNTLVGHFKAATNIDNIIVYDNVVIDDYFNNLKLKSDADYFVHSNEALSIIANRTLENIYDIQEKILNKMQTKFMAAQSYINNTSRLI